jgi:hypothetical protein
MNIQFDKYRNWQNFLDERDSLWKIYWSNQQPTLSNGDRYWNDCSEENDSLVFSRDSALGYKDKIRIKLATGNNRWILEHHYTPERFNYNDWKLLHTHKLIMMSEGAFYCTPMS